LVAARVVRISDDEELNCEPVRIDAKVIDCHECLVVATKHFTDRK